MRISTTTGFFGARLDGEHTPLIQAMQRCKAAGFDVIDANFCRAMDGKGELVSDNWEQLIYELRNEAEKIGMVFSQSHPVFFPGNPKDQSEETMEIFHKMMPRSIMASSILGVPWAILHPIEEKTLTAFDTEANIKKNYEFFAPTVELAMKHNVGIAFENMIERPTTKRRFSSNAIELAALADYYKDPGIGACWDFGHGNFLYKDQTIALRVLGKRLKATHINDNYGEKDEHMLPFHGSVDWHAIMPVLTEIGYAGDFTYETHRECTRLPEHIKDGLAKTAMEIAEYCLSLA